jgi:hypothetical protein
VEGLTVVNKSLSYLREHTDTIVKILEKADPGAQHAHGFVRCFVGVSGQGHELGIFGLELARALVELQLDIDRHKRGPFRCTGDSCDDFLELAQILSDATRG